MQEAQFYKKLNNKSVQCDLCPHNCVIKENGFGICMVRSNSNGKLVSHVYNRASSLQFDPIEKKPLYHFHPGKSILSVGGIGCNFHCAFCQNHSISQCHSTDFDYYLPVTPPQLVEKVISYPNCIGVAYTYNEPFTFYEFLYDCAIAVHSSDLKNVIVSNGYINQEPLLKLLPYIDAFNIDLKAFNNTFYKRFANGSIEPVLNTLKAINKSGKHLEITNLVIPELNDNASEFEEMVKWIRDELGASVPLHLSRYFPGYKLNTPPTPSETLETFHEIASKYLNYVFLGNVSGTAKKGTYCPDCQQLLIERDRYHTKIKDLSENNKCQHCNQLIEVILD